MYYMFDDYVLDTRLHELQHVGEPLLLEPQVFQLLTYLVQHRDRALSRQELFDYLWPEEYVSDAALERCISMARHAVGDNGNAQRVIKTLHGYGYRFIAAVEERALMSPQPQEAIVARPAATMPALQSIVPMFASGSRLFLGLPSLRPHTAKKSWQSWSCLTFQRCQQTPGCVHA